MRKQCLLACVALFVTASSAPALEYIKIKRNNRIVSVTGQVVVEAQDGGVLIEDRMGVLWAIQPQESLAREKDDLPFQRFDASQLQVRLLAALPEGFRVFTTAHYLVCYNTSTPYAQWCGALYERLYRGFFTFWKNRGCILKEPERPLIAVVFDDQESYAAYADEELGQAADVIIGYYSLQSNRVMMYDLTGADGLGFRRSRASTAQRVNRILSQPAAERTVATIIHEATHQLAFNCGLQIRYADNPLWLSEGLAIYFETPDLKNSRGWRRIGSVNRVRLPEFRQYLLDRPDDSLLTLIADDRRFRQPSVRQRNQAYAEAWALNYFLIRRYPREFVAYLKVLSAKSPLVQDEKEQRIAEFKTAFSNDLEKLDGQFLRFIKRVK